MIALITVFLLIVNQMDIHLVQNRRENCHHDHISFNVKGNRIRVFSVCVVLKAHDIWGAIEGPPRYHGVGGFQGSPHLGPHDASLWGGYTSESSSFPAKILQYLPRQDTAIISVPRQDTAIISVSQTRYCYHFSSQTRYCYHFSSQTRYCYNFSSQTRYCYHFSFPDKILLSFQFPRQDTAIISVPRQDTAIISVSQTRYCYHFSFPDKILLSFQFPDK